MAIEELLFSFLSVFAGWLSADHLASHVIVAQMALLLFIPALGPGHGLSARIAYASGQRSETSVRRRMRQGFWSLFVYACLSSLVAASGSQWMPELVLGDRAATSHDIVERASEAMLLVLPAYVVADACQCVISHALRGVSDFAFSSVMLAIGVLIGLSVCLVLAFGLGWELPGIWVGASAALGLAALAMALRCYWLTYDAEHMFRFIRVQPRTERPLLEQHAQNHQAPSTGANLETKPVARDTT